MTKAEKIAKLAELENKKFYLDMADRWTPADYDYNAKLVNEIVALKKELEA